MHTHTKMKERKEEKGRNRERGKEAKKEERERKEERELQPPGAPSQRCVSPGNLAFLVNCSKVNPLCCVYQFRVQPCCD